MPSPWQVIYTCISCQQFSFINKESQTIIGLLIVFSTYTKHFWKEKEAKSSWDLHKMSLFYNTIKYTNL